MALGTLIVEMVARMGRYHKLLLGLLMMHNFIVATNHTLTSFHIYRPPFHCRVLSDNKDIECETDCPGGYVFEGNATSVVTEFELVCSQRLLAPLLNTLYFVGVTIGAFVCGSLADIYGRWIMIIFCLYIQGILGIFLYFNHNLPLVYINRTIQGFFVQGLQGTTYALMLEQCNPKLRSLAGVTWQCSWSIGMIYLGLCSYFIPNWHTLQLALALPTIITLSWVWLIPESLTWLVTRGRIIEAYNLSIKLAKWNKDQKFLDDVREMGELETGGSFSGHTANINDILSNSILRKHAYIMTTMWFAIALAYYGILYFLPNVAGDRHVNFAVGALVEIASCILAYFIFVNWGRRLPMVIYQYVIATFCVTIIILIFAAGKQGEEPENWSAIPISVLAIVGKALAVAAFCGMFIYGGECFPTGCRGAAMGLCGFFARLGCIVSPQINVVGEFTFKACPLLIVAIFVTITGTATLLLPETAGITLPNTIDDVNELWGK